MKDLDLHKTLHQQKKEFHRLQIDYNRAVEKVEYWENIATQQNECIIMQSKRNDDLLLKNKELKEQLNKSSNVSAEYTELKVKYEAEKKRNTELDKMLETYEEMYSKLKKEHELLTSVYEEQKKENSELKQMITSEVLTSRLLARKLATSADSLDLFIECPKVTSSLKDKKLNHQVETMIDKINEVLN